MRQLMTLGYEGLNSQRFFEILALNKVSILVDVRELPLSRKTGFSKSALCALAEKQGIRYLHVPELGCPKAIRYDYKKEKDWKRYTNRFLLYLESQIEAVESIAKIASIESICLVCFEADYKYCHRSFVAQKIAEISNGLKVIHLDARVLESTANLHPALA